MANQQQNDSTSPVKGSSANLGQMPGQKSGQPSQGKQGQKGGQSQGPKADPEPRRAA